MAKKCSSRNSVFNSDIGWSFFWRILLHTVYSRFNLVSVFLRVFYLKNYLDSWIIWTILQICRNVNFENGTVTILNYIQKSESYDSNYCVLKTRISDTFGLIRAYRSGEMKVWQELFRQSNNNKQEAAYKSWRKRGKTTQGVPYKAYVNEREVKRNLARR